MSSLFSIRVPLRSSAAHTLEEFFRSLLLVLATALLAGCGSRQPANTQPVQRFSLHGEIVRLDGQANIATIRHQKIEGYMEAMTMQFPVKEPKDFASLHPSDCVNATVFVQGDDIWVGEIVHQPAEPGSCVAPPPAADSTKKP